MSIEALKRRVMNMVGRAVIGTVDDSRQMQSVQALVLADELHDDVERFQNYGLTSVPFADAEAVIVFAQGTRSHGIVIAVDDRRYRLRAMQEGEVALYDDQGQVVHLKRDGVLIRSGQKVRIEAPVVEVVADSVTVTADSVALGGSGGPAVARVGDSVSGGVITSGSSKVTAA